jgi:divalent metal cation (Fe/Co/Zn/Cd) transporter
LISLHAEIPAKLGAIEMHEITERCEHKLRKTFGGEVVCHTDPMMEMTPEIQAIEEKLRQVLTAFPQIASYHDFRVVAGTQGRVIIVADIDLAEDVNVDESGRISKNLETHVKKEIQNVLYCSFYITPKFSY